MSDGRATGLPAGHSHSQRAAVSALRCGLLAFLSLVCTGLIMASRSDAGTYTVYGCQTPSGARAPMDGWNANLDGLASNPLEYWQDSCPGAVFMYMTSNRTHPDGAFATETLTAPAATTIQGYTLWRAVRLVPSAGFYYETRQLSGGGWTTVDGCTAVAQCGSYGSYTQPTAASNRLAVTAPGDTTQVQLGIYCGSAKGCPPVLPNADSIWLFHSAVSLQDDAAPQFAAPPSGPLVAGGELSGVEPVSIGATDQGGGVYEAELEIDGHVVQAQVLDNATGTCQQPFVAVVPCPLSASGTLDFNTDTLPDGSHSLSILITDVAGNTTTWGPITITTDNNPCSPVPSAVGTTIRASFVRRHRAAEHATRELTVSYRQHPRVSGRVTTAAGAPVPAAPLCAVSQALYPGAPLSAAKSLRTNRTGHFSFLLGSGPSRRIYIVYRVPGGAVSSSVTVQVRVPVAIHSSATALRNNQVMSWRGRLPGPVPNGLIALMQVWRGTYWETFQQIGVTPSGHWIGRYRFHFSTGRQHYVFRLYVPHQSQYPYAAGRSKRLHVVVSG